MISSPSLSLFPFRKFVLFALLGLFALSRRGRLAIQPKSAEGEPPGDSGSNTGDPGPGTADVEAACPLVVGKVAHGNRVLLLDVGVEGPLVVNLEVKDAVLVRQLEGGRVGGAVLGGDGGVQLQTVEGRQHAEFQL